MQRAALVLLAGIGIAATVYYYDSRHASTLIVGPSELSLPVVDERASSPSPSTGPRIELEPRVIGALTANPDGTAQRAALYVAAARADVGDIKTLLAQAAAIEEKTTRAFALDVLLTRYAEVDAGGAVAAALDLEIKPTTLSALYRAWLKSSPTAALSALATLDRGKANGLWQEAASIEPAAALDHIEVVPADLRDSIEQTALRALGQRDPQAAILRLSQIPGGAMHQQLVAAVAWGFAQRDADGALAWAQSLQPVDSGALAAVVSGIGETNPLRGLDLAAEVLPPLGQMRATETIVFRAIRRDPTITAELLDRMVALPNNQEMQAMLRNLVTAWAQREPAKAAEWFVSNAASAPIDVVTVVASRYANVDPMRAATYTARLPSDARGAWLLGVAGTYADRDPRAALDWVEQFRGSPEYDDAAVGVIQSAARVDPAAVARAIESIGKEDKRRNAAATLAVNWAGRDPAAAATWAASLRDPLSQYAAVTSVQSFWATEDLPAARAWVLAQPAGQARDAGITMLLTTSARFGAPDASLLSSLSSEQARMPAVRETAVVIARRDPEAARAFVATNVADRSQRDGVFSYLSSLPDPPAGVLRGPGGSFFIPPELIRMPASSAPALTSREPN